ncbi:thioredoxin family protein [Lutimonas saemankumensis]|uniref:thioredoxin family protein n=1 Tax=Lutimonas saemankumensis TaxID=483016 RepID=UPI001CD78F6A|nr:thioredoxin family protein [Lutimonas saemankumensis]MCA0931556.1 thioredoxin family protein [Lutimonas saemankumensis]
MANTPSNMIPLGTRAENFDLFDTVSGNSLSLKDLKGEKGTVIFFICNHCPFVIHVNKELVRMANDYFKNGISFVAISSNDIEKYPQDGPELMKENAKNFNYPFPYLFDTTQEVARAYDAACTPDTYLFDKDLKLVYRGQIDDSRPGNDKPVNGKDLRKAMDFLLEGKGLVEPQMPSMGCGIKWK